MTTAEYPFADGDRLEERNTYFYTPFGGQGFLDAWRAQRGKVLVALPAPMEPVVSKSQGIPEPGTVKTAALFDSLLSALMQGETETPILKEWLYRVVKKFETTKRVHLAYDAQFRAVDRMAYSDIGLYVRLAEVLEAAYENTKGLVFLNALLKCVDTLCSAEDRLPNEDRSRVAWLIGREGKHVEDLAGAVAKR